MFLVFFVDFGDGDDCMLGFYIGVGVLSMDMSDIFVEFMCVLCVLLFLLFSSRWLGE